MKICSFCKKEFEPDRKERIYCSYKCSALARSYKTQEEHDKIVNDVVSLLEQGETTLSVTRKLNLTTTVVRRVIKEKFGNQRPIDAICRKLWEDGLNELEIAERLHIQIGGIKPILKRSIPNYQKRYEFINDRNTKRIQDIKNESRNRLAQMLRLYRKHKSIKAVADTIGANASTVSRKLGTSKVYKKMQRNRSYSEHWFMQNQRQFMRSKKYSNEDNVFIPLVCEKIKSSGISTYVEIEFDIGKGTEKRKGRKRRCDVVAIINGIKFVIQCKCESMATKEDEVIGQVIVAKTLSKGSVPVVCFPSDCSHSKDYDRVVEELGIIDTTEETIVEKLKKYFNE